MPAARSPGYRRDWIVTPRMWNAAPPTRNFMAPVVRRAARHTGVRSRPGGISRFVRPKAASGRHPRGRAGKARDRSVDLREAVAARASAVCRAPGKVSLRGHGVRHCSRTVRNGRPCDRRGRRRPAGCARLARSEWEGVFDREGGQVFRGRGLRRIHIEWRAQDSAARHARSARDQRSRVRGRQRVGRRHHHSRRPLYFRYA